jgi:antitoxin component YwqK of YwqJK toxin-antitoxin module
MKEGQRNGLWTFYYPNGKAESEGHYENGEQIGKWKFYNRWGSLSEVVDFDREKNI